MRYRAEEHGEAPIRPRLSFLDEPAETFRSAQRRALDERLARHLDLVGPPPGRGWVRAIREALGMSQYELGRRAEVSQPRVAQIERCEVRREVELETMRRMAEALDCAFEYVLAPGATLKAMVRRQALARAGGHPELAAWLVDQPGLWNPDRHVRRRWPPEDGS
jgi:predicted DNA-binding mobile mystery protein A